MAARLLRDKTLLALQGRRRPPAAAPRAAHRAPARLARDLPREREGVSRQSTREPVITYAATWPSTPPANATSTTSTPPTGSPSASAWPAATPRRGTCSVIGHQQRAAGAVSRRSPAASSASTASSSWPRPPARSAARFRRPGCLAGRRHARRCARSSKRNARFAAEVLPILREHPATEIYRNQDRFSGLFFFDSHSVSEITHHDKARAESGGASPAPRASTWMCSAACS